MNNRQVHELEQACGRAIADILGKEYEWPVAPQVIHLMSKAAIAVLEGVEFASKHQ